MARPSLKANKRKVLGRKVKTLRDEGILPANMYGKKIDSQAIKIDKLELEQIFSQAGETGLVDLEIDGEKSPVLITEIQYHPVTDEPMHVDFMHVDLREKVTANVPVEQRGVSPAEKQGEGTAVQYVDEIEVEALPANLPEKFEVDLSILEEVDQTITVGKIDAGDGVVIKNDPEQILFKVEPPREEEEEEELPTVDIGEISEEGVVDVEETEEGEEPLQTTEQEDQPPEE